MMRTAKHALPIIILGVLALLLGACSGLELSGDETLPEGAYPTDTIFKRAYKKYGGVERLGYAISTAYTTENGERGQYYQNVLMVYDAIDQTVYFAPLGKRLGLQNMPVASWDGSTEGGLMVGDHFILPAFASLYLSIGPEMVGEPLTDPFINHSQQRMEQHFANMGMSYSLNDPAKTVQFLPYGLVDCESCTDPDTQSSAIINLPPTDAFFYNQMNAQGITITLTGDFIEGPALRLDGTSDMIFDHVVLYEQDGVMHFRNVPRALGFADEATYTPLNKPGVFFYEIADGRGYDVFGVFDTYIRQQGGYEISGAPIAQITLLNAETQEVRQCFEHYCLDYNRVTQQVRPAPLGEEYLNQNAPLYEVPKSGTNFENDAQSEGGTKARNKSTFTLISWESHTIVDSSTPQTIFVQVELLNTPQPNMELVLTVSYPDGHEETYIMPPTNESGMTSYTLNPVAGENGNLVRYSTCLTFADQSPVCMEQLFMIWGNP